MLHNIKNIIIYCLILFFMYVILLRGTFIEGKKGLGIKKTVNTVGNTVENTFDDGVDFAQQEVEQAAAETKRIAEQAAAEAKRIAELAAAEAAAAALKLLDEAFDKLLKKVTGIATLFSSANQDLSNVVNTAANFEQVIVNSTNSAEQAQAQANVEQVDTTSIATTVPAQPLPTGRFGKGGPSKFKK